MPEVNPEIKILQDRLDLLEKENARLAKELKDHDSQAVASRIQGLEAEIKNRDTHIATLQAQAKTLEDTVKTLGDKLQVAETARTKAEADHASLQAEERKRSRIAALHQKGATDEQAADVVGSFNDLDDEKFNKMADTLAVAWSASKTPPTTKTEAAKHVIDQAKPDKTDPPLNTDPNPAGEQAERIAAGAKFFGRFLRTNNNVFAEQEA
jgi:chromosome segregation ATPase